jgi:hypothetical protein
MKMKYVASAFITTFLIGIAVTARADGQYPGGGYTNADIKGGYGCGVSGTLSGADIVGIAQFHPQGDGTFSASVFVLNIGGLGVCQYSLEKGTGTYDISANGTGVAQGTYSLQIGSAQSCPAEFATHLSFVCSGAAITANNCAIAALDPGVLLKGTCQKQNK